MGTELIPMNGIKENNVRGGRFKSEWFCVKKNIYFDVWFMFILLLYGFWEVFTFIKETMIAFIKRKKMTDRLLAD